MSKSTEKTIVRASTHIGSESYLDALRVFHWATKRHFQIWFTGKETKRHGRSEKVLPRLSRRGKARVARYNRNLIYALPRKTKFEGLWRVEHGLACTECLVRFYRANTDGEAIAERFFKGFGSVPEWGIRYPNGKMLLFEFSTKTDFTYPGRMFGKLSAYKRHLSDIEEAFQAKAVVVFVFDVPREKVKKFVDALNGRTAPTAAPRPLDEGTDSPNPFFFTDYKTFLSVPLGEALKAPIYFWTDGKEYSLSND